MVDVGKVQCSDLQVGEYVVLKGRPCELTEKTSREPDEFGNIKVNLVGLDIFTKVKYEDLTVSTHNMDVPRVMSEDYQVVDITKGIMSLMYDNGDIREDLHLPDSDLGAEIKLKFEASQEFKVTVVTAMGEEHAVAVKEAQK